MDTERSKKSNRLSIFISYSHADEAWKDRLVKQLRVLESEGNFEVWDDRRIGAGDDWYPAIEKALNEASMAILLVSEDFLTSPFILGDEVPRLLKRRKEEGIWVIPLIVWPPEFGSQSYAVWGVLYESGGGPGGGNSEIRRKAGPW